MKLIYSLVLLLLINCFSYGEVFIKIHEPIRFDEYNTRSIRSDILVGQGTLEVYTDNEKEDIGKKIIFRFPDTGLMTNRKKWIKIEKYATEDKKNEMIISNKRELVKFYAVIDKKKINKGEDPQIIEGDYIGYVPIILSLYSKK